MSVCFVALCCPDCLLGALQLSSHFHRSAGQSALLAVECPLLQAAVRTCAACPASGTSRTILRCRRSSSSGPRWQRWPRGANAHSRACSRRAPASAPSERRSAAVPAAAQLHCPPASSSALLAVAGGGRWGVLLAGPRHRLHRVDRAGDKGACAVHGDLSRCMLFLLRRSSSHFTPHPAAGLLGRPRGGSRRLPLVQRAGAVPTTLPQAKQA